MTSETTEHLESVGQRLRIAREAIGLSTREAAARLTLSFKRTSHVTVGNYERGTSRLPEDALHAFAQLYNRPVHWFCVKRGILEGLRYRALKSVSVRDKKDFSHHAQLWLETYLHVEGILGRNLSPKYPNFEVSHDESGAQLAKNIRELYKLRHFPIPSTIRLLEDFRIYVIQQSSNARIDGFAGLLGGVRVVVLNTNLSNDRIRLNALHELAHHLYEDCIAGPALSHEEVEKRAFEFASHLLIPDDEIEKAFAIKSMVRLVQYKERFGVSLAAMIYRAHQNSIITRALYQRLWKDFTRLGYRKNEPGHVIADRPVRMETLIDSAVQQKRISYAEIASVTGVQESSIRRRIEETFGKIIEEDNSLINRNNIKLKSN
ncbi:MAG: ImmA/IrrE family metallo-endopeptidase [Planctomycetes bacterium]|nr:ImmA/IrrE family metallo-endopeptidase [Planctomycetota bacterium]